MTALAAEAIRVDADPLTVEDLAVHFPTGRRGVLVHAVDGVSFSVRRGETFGIIGESGSGKSTLGRAIVGLTRPTSGRILLGDRDPRTLRPVELRRYRRQYRIIFQDPNAALNPRMTVRASIREPLDAAGLGTRTERDAKVELLLEQVGLSASHADRFPHELSGGQKQRVNIARALPLDPALIVCDEVVAALDVSIRAGILNLFRNLRRTFRLTLVFITHDIGVVSHISDRIAVMYLGRIVELGPVAGVVDAPLHPYTQALLSAEPSPLPSWMRAPRRITLQGEPPSASAPPSGCRFRTRCPLAVQRCADEEPASREAAPAHFVACHFAGQA